MSDKTTALLATGRVSNLPTVWCNCLAAALLIYASGFLTGSLDLSIDHADFTLLGLTLLIASSLFYVGGCFLGDYFDSGFDKVHKPDRPIPAGVLSAKLVLGIGLSFMTLGFLLVIMLPFSYAGAQSTRLLIHPTLLLILVINLYSRYHKKSLFVGLPLIGLCRVFLIIFAAACAYMLMPGASSQVNYPYLTLPILLFASAVGVYTISFASVARTESSDSPITWRKALRYTMLILPLLAVITTQRFHIETAVAILIYAVWLTHSFSFIDANKGKFVSKCLAGFCLLDACFIAHLGWQWLVTCIVLFLLSLQLQKIAPAT